MSASSLQRNICPTRLLRTIAIGIRRLIVGVSLGVGVKLTARGVISGGLRAIRLAYRVSGNPI